MGVGKDAYSVTSDLTGTIATTPVITPEQTIGWQTTNTSSDFSLGIPELDIAGAQSAKLTIDIDYDYLHPNFNYDPERPLWIEVDGTISVELDGHDKDNPESNLTTDIVQAAAGSMPIVSGVFNMLGDGGGFSKIKLTSDISEAGSQTDIASPGTLYDFRIDDYHFLKLNVEMVRERKNEGAGSEYDANGVAQPKGSLSSDVKFVVTYESTENLDHEFEHHITIGETTATDYHLFVQGREASFSGGVAAFMNVDLTASTTDGGRKGVRGRQGVRNRFLTVENDCDKI